MAKDTDPGRPRQEAGAFSRLFRGGERRYLSRLEDAAEGNLELSGAAGGASLELLEGGELAAPPPMTPLSILRRTGTAIRLDPRWLFGFVLAIIVLAGIFAPWVAPYPPLQYHPANTAQGPSLAHLFGTDALGRDQLSRVIYGIRISLSVGIASIVIGGIIGTLLGLVAGYSRGWVDQVITILVDALLAFPPLLLPLSIAAALGPSALNLVIALAIARVPIYARLARGQALQVRSLDYITAARSVGTRTWRILRIHVLPNIMSPLLVQATISVSFAILDESALSFLGLGSQPPAPEWGQMISDAQTYLTGSDPWMLLGPALAIVVTVLALNLLGDAIRDRLDPRSATRMVSINKL
jgi:peptide/nickel transport system permease protein